MFGCDFETVFDEAGGVACLTADFAFKADAVPIRGAPANGALLRGFDALHPSLIERIKRVAHVSMFRVAVRLITMIVDENTAHSAV